MQNKKPLRNQDYRLENMDDELLLFNPQTNNILYLNETAALIWQLCDGQSDVDKMVSLLTETFPEAGTDIEQDVEETIALFKVHEAIHLI
jgi:hypothetical protein